MEFFDYYMDPLGKKLQKNKHWEDLISGQPVRKFQKGEMIYWQGERADYFYYLKSGSICIFLSSENGTEKTLAIQKEGSVFGEASFFDELPRVSSARVLKNSEIIKINKPMLMNYIATCPEFAMDLLQYLSKTVRMLSAQVDHITFLTADKRIAQLILNLFHSQQRSNETNELSCSHEEIAGLVGVSRVTVSKILSRFVKKGWIETQYKKIIILDVNNLRHFAFLNENL